MAHIEPLTVLEQFGLVPRGGAEPLGGGDIGQVWRVDSDRGRVVVKHAAAFAIQAEADGLRALGEASTSLVVPQLIGVGDDVLVMEYLEPGRPDPQGLGAGLRALHANTSALHGWPRDNAAGTTLQRNTQHEDGRVFQREQRLLPLGRACLERGRLDARDMAQLERVAHGLESWLPNAPASLLHGDLWRGNVYYSATGAAVIDPAVYRHYPEVDIAMLELFGSPGAAFHDAYWDGRRPDDWPRRCALFQLYPLLNHLLLFGTGYRGAVQRTLARLD